MYLFCLMENALSIKLMIKWNSFFLGWDEGMQVFLEHGHIFFLLNLRKFCWYSRWLWPDISLSLTKIIRILSVKQLMRSDVTGTGHSLSITISNPLVLNCLSPVSPPLDEQNYAFKKNWRKRNSVPEPRLGYFLVSIYDLLWFGFLLWLANSRRQNKNCNDLVIYWKNRTTMI